MASNNYIYKMSNAGGMSTVTRYTDMLAGNAVYKENSYESIATVNGTGSATSVTFNSIPQTYTHLQVRALIRTTYASAFDTIYAYNYNNNTGSTGSAFHLLYGDGSSAAAGSGTASFSTALGYCPGNSANANVYGVMVFDILDYTNTNKNKTTRTLFGYDNNGSGQVGLTSGLPLTLPGTNAVTTLSLVFNGNITTASQFALYGVI